MHVSGTSKLNCCTEKFTHSVTGWPNHSFMWQRCLQVNSKQLRWMLLQVIFYLSDRLQVDRIMGIPLCTVHDKWDSTGMKMHAFCMRPLVMSPCACGLCRSLVACARAATGGCIQASKRSLEAPVDSAFAIIREWRSSVR